MKFLKIFGMILIINLPLACASTADHEKYKMEIHPAEVRTLKSEFPVSYDSLPGFKIKWSKIKK